MNDAQLLNSIEQQTIANYEQQQEPNLPMSLEQQLQSLRREIYSLQQKNSVLQATAPVAPQPQAVKHSDPRLDKVEQLSSFLINAVQLLKFAPKEGQVFTQTLNVIKEVTSAWSNSDFSEQTVPQRTLRERYEKGDTLNPEETKQLLDEILQQHHLEDGIKPTITTPSRQIEENTNNFSPDLEYIDKAVETAISTNENSTSLKNGIYEAVIQRNI